MAAEEDFEKFFLANREALGSMASLYCASRQEGEDLVQETFISAWRHWDKLVVHPNPEAWVRRVLHNLAMSRFRRRSLEERHRSQQLSPSVAPSPEHVDLVRAIHKLPERQRRAFVLKAALGLPISAIALELSAREGTVKSLIARARGSLARDLGADYEQMEGDVHERC